MKLYYWFVKLYREEANFIRTPYFSVFIIHWIIKIWNSQLKYYDLSSWLITKEQCFSRFPWKIHSFFPLALKYFKKEIDDNLNLKNIIFYFHLTNNDKLLNLILHRYITRNNKTRILNAVNLPISLKFTPSLLSIHEITIRSGIFQ